MSVALRLVLKRTADITVSAVALLLLLPAGCIIAALVVLESPGPVFYRAERVGFRGRPLRMLKFRKMHADAKGAALTTVHDSRLTRVGEVLTRTRLDELPQLWHVLIGEMSLIGPRPEAPCFVACREEDYEHILTVRPGITGPSQLAFADERHILDVPDPHQHYVTWLLPQKAALDRLYAQRISLRRELRLVLWTVVAVSLRQPVAVNRRTCALTLRKRPEGGRPAVRERRAPDHAAATATAGAVMTRAVRRRLGSACQLAVTRDRDHHAGNQVLASVRRWTRPEAAADVARADGAGSGAAVVR